MGRNRMMKFWQEQRGVSAVIGMLMMVMLFVTMGGIIQVSQVPIWNRQVEAEHAAIIYDDLIALKAGLGDVAVWRLPKSAVVHMGRLYPNRVVFVNPGIGITSSLHAQPVTITVDYTIDIPSQPTFTQTFQSSRLIYEAWGSSLTTLVYEYGIIIRDLVNANLSVDTQTLVRVDEIYVPLVDATNLEIPTSFGATSLTIKPFLASGTITRIKSVTVTLPTEYPEVWADRLDGVASGNLTITVDQVAKEIIITSPEIKQVEFSSGGVSENALYSGILALTKREPPALPPNFTNIDPNTAYPRIINIAMAPVGTGTYKQTHSTITATAVNTTAPQDIHLYLTGLTLNPLHFDEAPDYSSPQSIGTGIWTVPNSNTVRWTDITHPDYTHGAAISLTFWVQNTILNQQYVTTVVFVRSSEGTLRAWQAE